MPAPGEDALLVDFDLGVSQGDRQQGVDALLYQEELARGASAVSKGEKVVLVNEQFAQGPGGNVELGKIEGDTAAYKGDNVQLQVAATNQGDNLTTYTVDWLEDNSEVKSESKVLGGAAEVEYFLNVSKSSTGCFTYKANDSEEHRVCWMQIRPGSLTAFPRTVYLGASDTSSELSILVQVPSSEANSQDVTIDFQEKDLGQIASETQTISPGNTAEFTTTVQESTEIEREYTAQITNQNTGITVESNPATVKWSNDAFAAIGLDRLQADTRLLYKGDTVTMWVDAVNTTEVDVDYELAFFEGPTQFYTNTQTITQYDQVRYDTTRTKSTAGTRTFLAQDTRGVNQSNELDVTWMNVRPGDLDAVPENIYTDDSDTSSTISIPIENPGSDPIDVQVEFYENGSSIYANTKTIAAGATETYSTSRDNSNSTGSYDYQAEVTEQGAGGVSGFSNTVTVSWNEPNADMANLKFTGSVADNDAGVSAQFWAGDGSTDRIVVNASTPTYFEIVFNDDTPAGGDSYDFDDSYARFYQNNWDTVGYMDVEFYGSGSSGEDVWNLESFTHTVPANMASDPTFDEAYRFFQDGTVTDPNGNVVDSWK